MLAKQISSCRIPINNHNLGFHYQIWSLTCWRVLKSNLREVGYCPGICIIASPLGISYCTGCCRVECWLLPSFGSLHGAFCCFFFFSDRVLCNLCWPWNHYAERYLITLPLLQSLAEIIHRYHCVQLIGAGDLTQGFLQARNSLHQLTIPLAWSKMIIMEQLSKVWKKALIPTW